MKDGARILITEPNQIPDQPFEIRGIIALDSTLAKR